MPKSGREVNGERAYYGSDHDKTYAVTINFLG